MPPTRVQTLVVSLHRAAIEADLLAPGRSRLAPKLLDLAKPGWLP